MIQYVLDIICNILMWVTIFDTFASSFGIRKNWTWLDYLWIVIVYYRFFSMLNLFFVNSNSLPLALTTISIVNSTDTDHWK